MIISLKEFSIIEFKGADHLNFLNNQVSKNVSSLNLNNGLLAASLEFSGRIVSILVIVRNSNSTLVFVPNINFDKFKSHIEKYIISEDVEFINKEKFYYLSTEELEKNSNSLVEISLIDRSFYLYEGNPKDSMPLLEWLERYGIYYAKHELKGILINESCLNQYAMDYNKGCFIGQETARKINNNREASFYPMYLLLDEGRDPNFCHFKIENESLEMIGFRKEGQSYKVTLKVPRRFRINGKEVSVIYKSNVDIKSIYFFPSEEELRKSHSEEIFDKAIEFYNLNREKDALDLTGIGLKEFSNSVDLLELRGVILSKMDNFKDAIQCMDQIIKINPRHVMAYTNKSFFLMKLGLIEEAEKFKGIAALVSMGGEPNGESTHLLDNEDQKRLAMFLEVLEVDPLDIHANLQVVEIELKQMKYGDAYTRLTILPQNNAEVCYFKAYTSFKIGKLGEAKEYLKKSKELHGEGKSPKLANKINSLIREIESI